MLLVAQTMNPAKPHFQTKRRTMEDEIHGNEKAITRRSDPSYAYTNDAVVAAQVSQTGHRPALRRASDPPRRTQQAPRPLPTAAEAREGPTLHAHNSPPKALLQDIEKARPLMAASDAAAMMESSSSSSSPPNNSLASLASMLRTTSISRRPQIPRSTSLPLGKPKGVRFASGANGEPKCTVHVIPYSSSKSSSSSNRTAPIAANHGNQSPPLPRHTTRPAFVHDHTTSLSDRGRNRFRADSGRDSAPVVMQRRSIMRELLQEQSSSDHGNSGSSSSNNADDQQDT